MKGTPWHGEASRFEAPRGWFSWRRWGLWRRGVSGATSSRLPKRSGVIGAARRAAVHLICHRGVAEFAHENTLEAYRAAFELGADGNEVDIRATKDGVLVCFHDES